MMNTAYFNTASDQTYAASSDFTTKSTFDDNAAALLTWSQQYQPQQPQPQPQQFALDNELDVLVQQSMYNNNNNNANTLNNLFSPWNAQVHVPPTIKEEWPSFSNDIMLFPPTPVNTVLDSNNNKPIANFNEFNDIYPSREPTPPFSSASNSPNSSICYTPPPYVPHNNNNNNSNNSHKVACRRRKSAADTPTPTSTTSTSTTRTYRRRASSHPSVASVVSLTAHEPIARIIDGIEYITFLYSHDRLVKEYTVRTDVDTVRLEDIPLGFRVQNAIYPRANVPRQEYDGNRWEYETSCNKLGWELCWLNSEQLCGRRGLIQRAVDAYRNRHAEMRSRRVARQEKVANGTLRKRRAKKANSAIL